MDLISSSILGPVCDRVINAALDKYSLVRDVDEEIENLSTTVLNIKGVLEDAERKQQEDHISAWLKSLKRILLDAEDVLDEVGTFGAIRRRDEDSTQQETGWLPEVLNFVPHLFNIQGGYNTYSNRRDIAQQIQEIKKKLDHISREKDRLNLLRVPAEHNLSATRARRKETSSLLESQIIGRVEEKQQLEKLLLDSPEAAAVQRTDRETDVQVISVVGMGGVGKTTLVKHCYNNPAVKALFQLRMWVCVSNDFDVKRISAEIMDAASDVEVCEKWNWDATQRLLQGKLEDKRFLLVLDDVWEEDPLNWENLCNPLLCGGRGSKIVVTTRSQKVSKITKGTPISLRGLSNEDLWPIFQRYAFGDHDPHEHPQLVLLGRQIMEKLGGLPLAAKTVGALFYLNPDARHWIKILKSKAWALWTAEGGKIMSILKLSYDHLPGQLKQCFAYCSLFPEEHFFDKGILVSLWVAQQFIQSREGRDEEDLGSEYFDDLISLSLFEKPNEYGYVMHDLIHNLSESVSEDDCLRLEDSHLTNSNRGTSATIRHISVCSKVFDPKRMEEELCQRESLRTLLFLRGSRFQLGSHLHNIIMRLQRLRVLGLSDCEIRELPESIGSLKHLRYLDLSSNRDIRALPESFCNLRNLQFLNLRECRRLGQLPKNMSALINLRHLYNDGIENSLVNGIEGLGKLTAFHELRLDCRKNGQPMKELANMSMLRRLWIFSLEEVKSKEEAVESRLGKKERLEQLILRWNNDHKDEGGSNPTILHAEVLDGLCPPPTVMTLNISGYRGVRSPSWMEDQSWICNSFLESVTLGACENWEVLPPLGRLPCLRKLEIGGMKRVRRIGPPHFLACCTEGDHDSVPPQPQGMFPFLEVLTFANMDEWEEWKVPSQGHPATLFAPRLTRLGIINCPKLTQLPPLTPALTELTIENCHKLTQLPPLPPALTQFVIRRVGLSELPRWLPPPTPSSSVSALPSLSSLTIDNCSQLVSLEEGLLRHPLPKLVTLKIKGCHGLVSLPETGLGHLTSLKKLEVFDCPKLSWRTSLPLVDALPPSLEEVDIEGEMIDVMMQANCSGSEKLSRLTTLRIKGCVSPSHSMIQQRRDCGALPTSLQHLSLENNKNIDNDTLSAWLRGLTCLTELSISDSPAIVSLPGSEVLSQLSALVSLKLRNLNGLRHFGQGIYSLNSLESLSICDCPALLDVTAADSSASSSTTGSHPAGMEMTNVRVLSIWNSSLQQIKMLLHRCPSIRELRLGGDDEGDGAGGELESALLHLSPTLRSLGFFRCGNLRSLPPNLKSLSSLNDLRVFGCDNIRRLPVGGLPQSLQSLYIMECATLEKRLEEKEGEDSDWPLISHIPHLGIRY